MKKYLRPAGELTGVKKIGAMLAFFRLAVAAAWYTSEHPAASQRPRSGAIRIAERLSLPQLPADENAFCGLDPSRRARAVEDASA